MGTLADDEIRDVAALLPARNADRMFSDAQQQAGASAAPRSAPGSFNRAGGKGGGDGDGDGDGRDSGSSYYYYYSSEAGADTRAGFSDDGGEEEDAAGGGKQGRGNERALVPHGGQNSKNARGGGGGYGAALTQSLAGSASYARDNIADAVGVAARHFATDDVAKITAILRRRLRQLLPALRRLAAHFAAFFAGVSHLQRTLSAVSRALASDSHLRELAQRTGAAGKESVRVALVLLKAVGEVVLRGYRLAVGEWIPKAKGGIPRGYAKVVLGLVRAAGRSPWVWGVGPVSLTVALSGRRLPEPLLLHRKFGVGVTRSVRESYERVVGGGRYLDVGDAGRDGGEGDGGDSLGYTYTYGTVTTRMGRDVGDDAGGVEAIMPARGDDDGMTADGGATTGEYYYTYGSGTYGGGRGDDDIGDMAPLRDSNGHGGRGHVDRRGKAGAGADGGGFVGKENGRMGGGEDDLYDDGGDGMYDYD